MLFCELSIFIARFNKKIDKIRLPFYRAIRMNYQELANKIKIWAKELGFQKAGIYLDVDLQDHESNLQSWLDAGYHGEMDWMARHGMKGARPHELVPGTLRVISVRMDYLPPEAQFAANLAQPNHAYQRYALGRDYHKLLRNQLKKLGQKIEHEVGQYGYRPLSTQLRY